MEKAKNILDCLSVFLDPTECDVKVCQRELINDVAKAIDTAIEEEREACAKVAGETIVDELYYPSQTRQMHWYEIEAAIRERGK